MMVACSRAVNLHIEAELVLIAAGFLGCQSYVSDAFGVELTPRTNVKTAARVHMKPLSLAYSQQVICTVDNRLLCGRSAKAEKQRGQSTKA